MTEAVFSGIGLGLVLAVLIGPVFFLLINVSLADGFKPAMYIATGVVLSDALYILIVVFAGKVTGILNDNHQVVGIAGGLLLIFFGFAQFIKKPEMQSSDLPRKIHNKPWINFVSGFTLNLLNPFVLIFWIGVTGGIRFDHKYAGYETLVFFSSALVTIYSTDLLKAKLALTLRRMVTLKFLLWLNRLSGIGLMAFGIHMMYKVSM